MAHEIQNHSISPSLRDPPSGQPEMNGYGHDFGHEGHKIFWDFGHGHGQSPGPSQTEILSPRINPPESSFIRCGPHRGVLESPNYDHWV